MNIDKLFKSQFFKAADIMEGPVERTITGVEVRDVGGEDKPEDQKAVVMFEGQAQGLVLNLTNKEIIKLAFGSETANWPGKRIGLYATTTQFGSKMVDCVRVSIPVETSVESLLST